MLLESLDNRSRFLFMHCRFITLYTMTPGKRVTHEEIIPFFLPLRLATIGFVLLVIILMGKDPPAQAELSANQVMIVANANSRESLMVAEHYATRRGVPAATDCSNWIFRSTTR